jgi:hypothetical protein
VREFHPPPKVSQQPIPQKDQRSKECPRTSTYSYAPGACRIICGQGRVPGGNPITRYYALVLAADDAPEDEACDLLSPFILTDSGQPEDARFYYQFDPEDI